MKVLLVNGSYHEHGCTRTALDEVAKALNANGVETEIYWIGENAVNGCKGCWACKRRFTGSVSTRPTVVRVAGLVKS